MSTPLATGPTADGVLVDGIVASLSGHRDLTQAQKAGRTRDIRTLVASLEPRDAMETMLIGQCLLFNEVIADAGKDLLDGMPVALKLRAQSNLNGLNRSLHQNLNMLLRRREKAAAALAASEAEAAAAKPPAQRPEAAPTATPPKANAAPSKPGKQAPTATPVPDEESPLEATSWVDEAIMARSIGALAEAVQAEQAEQAKASTTDAPPQTEAQQQAMQQRLLDVFMLANARPAEARGGREAPPERTGASRSPSGLVGETARPDQSS